MAKETIAACLWDLGFSSRAEASERESLAIRTKAFGADSLGAAESLNNLGVILAREQRFSEGEQSLDRAAFILERIGERGVRHLIAVLGNLGTLYFMQAPKNIHFYSEAEKVYRRKLALEEPLFGDLDIRVSATLELLGEALYGERAYDEAGQTFGRGLALQEAALGPADPRTQAAVKRYHILTKKVKAYAMK